MFTVEEDSIGGRRVVVCNDVDCDDDKDDDDDDEEGKDADEDEDDMIEKAEPEVKDNFKIKKNELSFKMDD